MIYYLRPEFLIHGATKEECVAKAQRAIAQLKAIPELDPFDLDLSDEADFEPVPEKDLLDEL